MSERPLAPSSLLYRFSIPCHHTAESWQDQGITMSEAGQLPHFSGLDRQGEFAEVRCAWNEQGLYFRVNVRNKQQSLWCRSTQMLESDRLMIWLDTRNTHNVHRATRFCHWFLFMPIGDGKDGRQPCSTMLKINRAKENSPTLNRYRQLVASKLIAGGYQLDVLIPGKSLSGWDPAEHTHIGFNYAVVDRELGWQTLASGPELPIEHDPSLWHSLELLPPA